ncbi:MAG TPA: hypothetical protein VK608_04240 [Edaphobacter sp.]|nr:hypothetical protein [Edaphobacter sp.]
MFRLEAVDGDDDIEALEVRPMSGNGAEGAGDNLDVNAPLIKRWQESFKFPIADQGIAADKGDMEGLMLVDDTEHVFY